MYEIYIAWKEGFQATGTVCIVMEKIEGKEMFEVIQSCGHYDGIYKITYIYKKQTLERSLDKYFQQFTTCMIILFAIEISNLIIFFVAMIFPL